MINFYSNSNMIIKAFHLPARFVACSFEAQGGKARLNDKKQ